MTYRFIATVCQQFDGIMVDSKVTVEQLVAGNAPVIVAYINDSADPADHRRTTINFAEGSLSFSAAYDGPLRENVESPFRDASRQSTQVTLHQYFFARKTYLSLDSRLFPITVTKDNGHFQIIVYDALPQPQEDQQEPPVLAAITKTKAYADGYEYEIQTNGLPPTPLLMAVFSLPFTLNV